MSTPIPTAPVTPGTSVQPLITGLPTHLDPTQIGVAFLAFLLPILVGAGISWFVKQLGRHKTVRRYSVYRLVTGSINIVAVIIGLLSALSCLGVNVTALVTGLGLTGLALGLALKDTVSNLVAGIMVIVYSPFDIEDQLEITGIKGVVVDMDLRYVSVQTETEIVLVPNSSFLNNVIKKKRDDLPPPPPPEAPMDQGDPAAL